MILIFRSSRSSARTLLVGRRCATTTWGRSTSTRCGACRPSRCCHDSIVLHPYTHSFDEQLLVLGCDRRSVSNWAYPSRYAQKVAAQNVHALILSDRLDFIRFFWCTSRHGTVRLRRTSTRTHQCSASHRSKSTRTSW